MGVKQPPLDLSYAEALPVLPFQAMRIQMFIVGLGGNGSFLARHAACLVTLLQTMGKQVSLTFVDPDQVEEGNIPRQNFCPAEIGYYKAEALARRYSAAFGIPIGYLPTSFESAMVSSEWNLLTVLVGCVDRASGRIALGEVLQRNRDYAARHSAPRIWYLDLGNGVDYGQVLLGTTDRVEDLAPAFCLSAVPGCSLLPSPLLQQPGLRESAPEELEGPTLSCAQLLAARAQSMTINAAMADEAADYLYRLLVTGDLKRFATYIDLPTGTKRSHYTTPPTLARIIGRTPSFFKRRTA